MERPKTTTVPRFVRACRRQPVDRTPVWFMRQAGRSLPEYRAIRAKHTLFEIARQPELCAEVTLQPVRRLGVDAAILFSDIMLPLAAVGVELELVENVGPVVKQPIRTEEQVRAIRALTPAGDMPYVLRTVEIVRRVLQDSDVALIGFAGAPFTMAGYLIEGRPSREFVLTKQMMYREPALWSQLMEKLADIVIAYAQAQVASGAQAIQIFDSWAGCLSPRDYSRYVVPHMRRIFEALRAPESLNVPLIHFGTGTAALLELMADAGGDVIGLDWRVSLGATWDRLGGPARLGVQGNLDPAVAATAPWDVVRAEADAILRDAGGRPGHIFNLGHGVLPTTPVETLRQLVEHVHSATAAQEPVSHA